MKTMPLIRKAFNESNIWQLLRVLQRLRTGDSNAPSSNDG